MKKICMLRKYLIVSYICFFILMPLSFTNSTKKSTENIATNSNENLIKIVSFKADSASIMYYPFGHLGSIWWSPLQFNVHRGAMELEVNGELQTVDLPVWIGLRYYLGIGPSLKDMAQGLGVKVFGICGDVAVMPFSLLFSYIYSQPLFYISDIVDFGQTAWGLATADFNNDTHMDFVVSSADAPFTHSTISIFYNNGDGSFTREDVYRFAYSYITDLNAGDYNNDGQIDLLFTYSEYTLYGGWLVNVNGSGILLFNDGNNVFGNPTLVFHHGPGIPYDDENRINPQVVSADFNNDGTLDFVVGDNSGKVEFYTNEGTGIFTSAGIINDWGNCSWGFTVGDFDSDFDFDFMVSAQYGITDGRIYLIYNQMMESNGSICFASGSGEALLNYSSIGSPCLQTLDYNDDGQFDLIVGIDNHVFLCINTQNSFEIVDLGQLPENEEGYGDDLGMGSLSVGDYNNDRKDDVLIGGVQGVIRLCLNIYNQQLPPFIPWISYLSNLVVGKPVDVEVTTTDFNENDVWYWVDWGDGTNSGWVGPFVSGESILLNHTWKKAVTFYVKVKAKNMYGESGWKYSIAMINRFGRSTIQRLDNSFVETSNSRFLLFSSLMDSVRLLFKSPSYNTVKLYN